MPPKGPSRPGRQQLAQAGPLRRFCTASKTLLDADESVKNTIDDAYINSITDTLMELGATAESLDDEGRSALFVALHNCITAVLRWPVPSTKAELRAELSTRKLCAVAARCARNLVKFDDNGAFLQSQQQRDAAVTFASALLESNALQSFAQRLSEGSVVTLDGLLRYQLNQQQQQQQQEERPMGQAHQQQQYQQAASKTAASASHQDRWRQGTEASCSSAGGSSGSSSSSSRCGIEDTTSLLHFDVPRLRVEQWLLTLDELGAFIHAVARHDPYAPTSEHQPSSIAGFGAHASMIGPLERCRPPPIQPMYASVVASSRIFEHAARAMVTVAMVSAATNSQGSGLDSGGQAERSSRERAGGGRAAAGAGARGGGGGRRIIFGSSFAIESCASLMQRVGLVPEVASIKPAAGGSSEGSGKGDGGRGSSSKSSGGGGGGSGSKKGHDPATGPWERQPPPHPFGPWSRYVLLCLGLRCLHDLDGGSCYGMPPELVRGMPETLAPGTLVYDEETGKLERTSLTPVQLTASRLQVLRDLVRVLEPVGRTARAYGTGARGTEVYGSGALGLPSAAGAGAGAAGTGPPAAVSGRAAGQVGAGGERWPVVGPKAARGISRRVVGWALGLARGWVAEEERRRRAGGGAGRGGGLNPWGTLRMGGPAGSQHDNDEHVLTMGKSMVGPLTVQALGVFRRTLGDGGDGGVAAEQQEEQQQVMGDGGEAAEQQEKQQQALEGREPGAGKGGVGGGAGHGRQRLRQAERREQQQQVLLAEWYGMACGVVQYALRWRTGDNSGCDLAELMALGLPLLTRTDSLPPLPPPRLAAALSGGYLPCLDTLLRRCGRGFANGDLLLTSHLVLHRRTHRNLVRICSGTDDARSNSSGSSNNDNSGSIIGYSHDLPWLLAYGSPRQSASLLASMAKMLSRAARKQQDNSGDAAQGWGGAGFAAPGPAAPANEVEKMVADGLASMLSIKLGGAFEWMQERAGGCSSFDGSAAGASAPCAYGAMASSARADGTSAAGGDDPGAGDGGSAAGFPKGPERLRLLLSFALAKVVPPLTCHLILQCRQLTMRTGVGAPDGLLGDDDAAECADEVSRLAGNLGHLLYVLLAAQKTVWRCRDLVGNARGAGAGHGSGGGSGGSSASAAGQLATGAEAAGVAELGVLADGLQGLLDGEADMAGLVGAALDCLQLLPASDGGQLAATVLELSHCALWSCQHEMGPMRLPDGSRVLSFSAASPIVEKVLWGASASAEKLRAAVAVARFAGYATEARYGDTLVTIASRSLPGCDVCEVPEVPLWLLGPGEVVRELGGSCCCNARCTRLEGDSEAGEGQGQGLLVCGRCRGAWYCGRECQAVDWAAGHKMACKGE